jgi:hypothetical protein
LRRVFVCLFLLVVPLVYDAGCRAAPPAPADPNYRLTATVKDIMDSMVDPIADIIWNSTATIVTYAGVEERQPRTDEDWLKLRHAALTLAEATNLLIMPGREIAKPGEKSEHPGIELQPEEIAKLVKDKPEEWIREAHGLHDAVMLTLKAIDTKNVDGIIDAGEKLDAACEKCHLDHWYPSAKKPAIAPSMRK